MDRVRYRPVPVYISKNGDWYTGAELLNLKSYQDVETLTLISQRVHLQKGDGAEMELVADVPKKWFGKQLSRIPVHLFFLALHGGEGENGALQGLCETYNIPYTGSGVFGSAVGMDKVLSKMICRDQNIPVVPFVSMSEPEWIDREEERLDACEALGYPMIVKPARLGSSIGITRAQTRDELDTGIEEAFRYDEKVIVEYAVPNLREINCSVIGDTRFAEASVLEEPLSGEELLSFQDKYMRAHSGEGTKSAAGVKSARTPEGEGMASLDRIIPAPLSNSETEAIQKLAVQIFQLFECSGVARLDFLLNNETGAFFFNEINTIPGSFSFYLWEPSGIPFDALINRLIDLALKRQRTKNRFIRTYDVNLLALRASGAKGVK